MKKFLISLFMIIVPLCVFAQEDAKTCKEAVLPFLPPFEGYYLSDNCKFSEFFNYDFYVNGGVPTKKEGGYRETWYKRKSDNSRHISGPQILKQQSDALKAIGGEEQPGSSGKVFKLNYQGKEFWIYVNANTYSEDLDNYGVISIEAPVSQQQTGSHGTTGTQGMLEPPGPAGLNMRKGTFDTLPLSHILKATSLELSKLKNIPVTAAEREFVIPSKWLVAQDLPGTAKQLPSGQTSISGHPVHTIGEHYGGGIVFYVYDNGQHGLIAAKEDLGPVCWNPILSKSSGWKDEDFLPILAYGFGVGAGKLNTAIIVSAVGFVYQDTIQNGSFDKVIDYAASLCSSYFAFDDHQVLYGDWYLPSIWELNLLFIQKAAVGNLGSAYYWSSTEKMIKKMEDLLVNVYVLSFLTGDLSIEYVFLNHPVRPIRSF